MNEGRCRKRGRPWAQPHLAICHPTMGQGGSESRAMWALQALKNVAEISLVTTRPVNLLDMNRFYGTNIKMDEIHLRIPPLARLFNRLYFGDAFRAAAYQRFCRSISYQFDIMISTYNLCDFGRPGIHFLADFSWIEAVRNRLHPHPPGLRSLIHKNRTVRAAYLHLARRVSRPSGRNLFAGEDFIFANSAWSASIFRKHLGVSLKVIYPPVAQIFHAKRRENREFGFVCIGRIFPEKRIERIIDILKKVRRRGHNIHLHIIGKMNASPYSRLIHNLCRDEKKWVVMEGMLAGHEKASVLAKHRFGIHACLGEAFGIGVAEMVKAGCTTFAPIQGGPAEIIDHPSLLYNDAADAVDKIDTVLQQPILQNELQRHLEEKAKNFSVHRFKSGLLSAVEKFMKTMNIMQQ